jgi:hypothetical protein
LAVCAAGARGSSGWGMTGCSIVGASVRLALFAEVERILRLYRERYAGFNIRHFHQLVRRDEQVMLSYTFVHNPAVAAGAGGSGDRVGRTDGQGQHDRGHVTQR